MTAPSIDPSVFDPAAIDDETKAFNEQLEKALATVPPTHQVPPQVTRDARESGQGLFGPVVTLEEGRNRTIAGPGGDLTLRVFTPPTVEGVYLHLHGGGWVLGRAHHSDVRNWAIARHCNLAVVSVDYRLAPENPYPAGPDDCEAAAAWLLGKAKEEFGTEDLFIGGESAGGHLAAVTLLRMRDRHGYTGWKGANLVYGAFDCGLTPSVANWGDRNLVLSTPIVSWFVEQFLAPGVDRRGPDVSPLYADLRDMPPALFTVGSLDPLRDDSLFMYMRWVGAGNEAELAVYPGGVHGFNGFPIALGARANSHIDAWLTAHK